MNLQRTLVIAPHPDDESVAVGALLQRVTATGGSVRIIFATDGENNPWPQRRHFRRWRITAADRAEWAALRRDEVRQALGILGIDPSNALFAALPDYHLMTLARRNDDRLTAMIRSLLSEWQPTLVVTASSHDTHADHRAVAWFTHRAVPPDTPLVTYVVHGRDASRQPLLTIDPAPEEQRRKRGAILCHRSQLAFSHDRFVAYASQQELYFPSEYDRVRAEPVWRTVIARIHHAAQAIRGAI